MIQRFVNKVQNEEPVFARMFVLWALAFAGELLVGHHVVTRTEWSSWTNSVAPTATTVVLGVLTWSMRSRVSSPATVAKLQAVADKVRSLSGVGPLLTSVAPVVEPLVSTELQALISRLESATQSLTRRSSAAPVAAPVPDALPAPVTPAPPAAAPAQAAPTAPAVVNPAGTPTLPPLAS